MKYLLSILFCCCVYTASISANTQELKGLLSIEAQGNIDEPAQYSQQLEILSKNFNEHHDHHGYFYRIKDIDVEDRSVWLEDDSKWDIGWWYSDVIKDWQVHDRVTVTITNSFNGFGIHNLDRDSLAWSSIWKFNLPTVEKSDAVVEVNYDNSDYKFVLVLKSGFKFGIPKYWIFGPKFKVGDSIFIFKNGNQYLVNNLSTGDISETPTLLEEGNSDWRRHH